MGLHSLSSLPEPDSVSYEEIMADFLSSYVILYMIFVTPDFINSLKE